MENFLVEATEVAVWFVEALVLVVVVAATAKAAWSMVRLPSSSPLGDRHASRLVWLGYARWLVAALTLQLGADILDSSIAPSWQAIAQLGAIAAIRTFLSYFLERDIREVAERESPQALD